jgi:hypothetical protein
MKKILKNGVVQICFALVAIAALIILCVFSKTEKDLITRVSKVLWAKYYKIECINTECKYVVAYKGEEAGKTTVKIINTNGKTVVKYTVDYSVDKLKKVPVNATSKYAILALKDDKDYTHGYSVVNSRGKEVLREEEKTLYTITDKYFYSKTDELYTIYDYKGNELFKDVKELTFYNDKKIITFVNDGLNIIDENSNRILDDYEIVEDVKEDNKTLYLIVRDKADTYYYFDVKDNKIVGDSFYAYVIMSDNRLLVTRKSNNEIKKYVLDANGKEKEEISSKSKITEKIKEGYEIVEDSILSADQKGILVRNISENSLGTYELKTGKYEEIFKFKDASSKEVNIYNLYKNLETARLEVGCSRTYCNEETILVYDPFENKIMFKVIDSEKEIRNYREYKNGYKVITYKDKTYALYDDEGNLLLKSINNIVVPDQKVLVDDKGSESSVILYSTKEKKPLNDDNTLALLDKSSDYKLYRYFDDEKMYLFDKDGKKFKEIPIAESSVIAGDKYILNQANKKVTVYNLIDNSENTFKLNDGDSLSDENSAIIAPNKGMIVITNKNDENIRVLNYKGKTIKKLKNSTVKSVNFDKESNKAFLITKTGKTYGLYIIK